MAKKATKTAASKKDKEPGVQKNIKVEDQEVIENAAMDEDEVDNASVKNDTPEADTEDSSEGTDQTQQTEDKTDDADAKAREWQDKYMRLSAEFDNYRKRTLKEKTDLIKMANEDLLKDILSVVDDFERGIEHIDKSEDIQALKDGIHLIHGKFNEFLKNKGIKEIEAKEKEFDLEFHEALTKIPAPSEELKGKVVDVVEKGYTLNDKVIRYAKVVVGD